MKKWWNVLLENNFFAMKIVVFLILGLKFRHNMLQLLHKCYKKQAKNVKQGWKVSIL